MSAEPQPVEALPGPLIALRNVDKTYSRGGVATEVLHDVSLDIYAGEFVALMGASGSGKSTLINLIGLLDRPTAGNYLFDGHEVSAFDADDRAALRREAFGFIFQQYNLLPSATASQNVEMPAIYAGVPHDERVDRAQSLLTMLGLGERLKFRPTQLSGGQQQRVSIARALMNGGAVILADEPTGALDSKSGEEVMALLRDLNAQGHTIVLVTHDLRIAEQADRIVEIRDGRILPHEPPPIRPRKILPSFVAAHRAAIAAFLPPIGEAIKIALRSLRSNKLRTLLTLLGIIIGVASVVTLLAIGDGVKHSILGQLSTLGPDLLLVRPGAPNLRPSSGVTATLVESDADALVGLSNVRAVVPEFSGAVTVRYANRDYRTMVNATNQSFPTARNWAVEYGGFFDAKDQRSYAAVTVLGRTVADALFGVGEEPLGRFVLVNNVPFQVIGIMARKGATPFGTDMDDVVFTPLSTGGLRLFGQRYVQSITVQVWDVARIDQTMEAIRTTLTARHRSEDFQTRSMAAILATANNASDILTLFLGSLAFISLLVGGIGVMNIMLVSVAERTREIGIRMATGARRFDILMQFNSEALAVCSLGGIIGIGLGLALASLFAAIGQPVLITLRPVLMAFACAFGTGLVFGFLPARKAASLDPVLALATH